MNKFVMNKWIATVLCLLFLGVGKSVFAQRYHLEDVQLYNLGDIYRVILQCDGPAKVVHKLNEEPLQLVLYFVDTKSDLRNQTFRKKTGLIKDITVTPVKGSLNATKVSIYLTKKVNYKVNKGVEGLYYVDFKVKGAVSASDFKMETFSDAGSAASDFGSEEIKTTHNVTDRSAKLPLKLEKISLPKSRSLSERTPAPMSLQSKESITLDVKNAEIGNVLRLMARQSGLNIVASKDVKGVLTVSLAHVTIREALDMVVKANGYDYITDGDVILVKPRDQFKQNELETKVYRLKYIDANNVRSIVSQVLSKQAKIQVFYANFQPSVKLEEDKAEIPVKRSSVLVVTDSPPNIQKLDAMLTTLDVSPPQIMIEAKLIEISPQNERNIGIDWSKTVNAKIFKEIILPSGTPQRNALEVPFKGGSINYGTLNIEEYDAVLNFLSTNTHTKLVSNPRILASDNQEAHISVGTTFPIPQINRGVGGQGDFVTFEYRDVNISLSVTPHIGDDQTITLFVNPEIEEIIGQVQAGDNSAPITSKRTVQTVVNLKSDETMVIGGLIKENTSEQTDKVWLLGDIPLLGNFFRNTHKTKSQTDLLIFITPRLVRDFK